MGNCVGKTLIEVTVPAFGDVSTRKFSFDARTNLARLFVALRAYHADTGSLPESLSRLVPQHIETIPGDPFGDRTLQYYESEQLIYSVGSDMMDNDGDRARDICVELNFH